VFALLAVLAAPAPLVAQHQHHDGAAAPSLLRSSQSRTASGTAWLPDSAPVPGFHRRSGGWDLMVHGTVFLQVVRTMGTRALTQLGSTNWVMGMASRVGTNDALRARVMMTAEPFTLEGQGYPQLLQVAHAYRGTLAPDRQHPHELFPEISIAYERRLGRTGVSLYAAPIGEPALGPVAYNHRPSAAYDPTAPLGHVAQDYTHESLGVLTVGAFGARARIDASLFNGSHPDDRHANFDLQGGRLNAYAGRITVAASGNVVASAWIGYIPEDTAHAHGAQHKFGASVAHSRRRATGASWSSALIYGANRPAETRRTLGSVLLESSLDVSTRHTLFGRIEYARRTDEELALTGSVPEELDVGAVSLGYAFRSALSNAAAAAAGVRLTVAVAPAALAPFYGSRTPLSVLAYLRLGPPER
jgi:hypothetical protein